MERVETVFSSVSPVRAMSSSRILEPAASSSEDTSLFLSSLKRTKGETLQGKRRRGKGWALKLERVSEKQKGKRGRGRGTSGPRAALLASDASDELLTGDSQRATAVCIIKKREKRKTRTKRRRKRTERKGGRAECPAEPRRGAAHRRTCCRVCSLTRDRRGEKSGRQRKVMTAKEKNSQ